MARGPRTAPARSRSWRPWRPSRSRIRSLVRPELAGLVRRPATGPAKSRAKNATRGSPRADPSALQSQEPRPGRHPARPGDIRSPGAAGRRPPTAGPASRSPGAVPAPPRRMPGPRLASDGWTCCRRKTKSAKTSGATARLSRRRTATVTPPHLRQVLAIGPSVVVRIGPVRPAGPPFPASAHRSSRSSRLGRVDRIPGRHVGQADQGVRSAGTARRSRRGPSGTEGGMPTSAWASGRRVGWQPMPTRTWACHPERRPLDRGQVFRRDPAPGIARPGELDRDGPAGSLQLVEEGGHRAGELGVGQVAEQAEVFGHLLRGPRRAGRCAAGGCRPARSPGGRARRDRAIPRRGAAARAGLRRPPSRPACGRCSSARPTSRYRPPSRRRSAPRSSARRISPRRRTTRIDPAWTASRKPRRRGRSRSSSRHSRKVSSTIGKSG